MNRVCEVLLIFAVALLVLLGGLYLSGCAVEDNTDALARAEAAEAALAEANALADEAVARANALEAERNAARQAADSLHAVLLKLQGQPDRDLFACFQWDGLTLCPYSAGQ